MNYARAFLDSKRLLLSDYEGYCLELVIDVLHFIGRVKAHILYIEVPGHGRLHPNENLVLFPTTWYSHAVVLVDGLVHDAHLQDALPVRDYLRRMFRKNEKLELTYFPPERVETWLNEDHLERRRNE